MNKGTVSYADVKRLFELPFLQLQHQAQNIHRENFPDNELQLSVLCSIKTGHCPEDCAYCPQSGHYKVDIKTNSLLDVEEVRERAEQAKAQGATRFCMGAAWKYPPRKDLPKVLDMIAEVKALGLETCVTLGSLSDEDAKSLKGAGLDYYNHNLDTSPEYYKKIITTRSYEERLATLDYVQEAGMKTCCGGIIGMGETREDRIGLLLQLANLKKQPESVPINRLIAVKGTPLGDCKKLDNFEFIRVIAVARILMPKSYVRISAGRDDMSEEMQTLCFICGANSIFLGDELLTTKNVALEKDRNMMGKLDLQSTSVV